jgi:hypothetical protein
LLFAADLQTGETRIGADLEWFVQHQRADIPPTWKETVISDLVAKGYGKDWTTLKTRGFLIGGLGLEQAERIRESRRPKSLLERIRSVPRSDWIALGALLVSLIALFR